MRILMVSSYPPMPCGIGAYAVQHVAALRAEGNVVDVFAHPAQGPDGDFICDLMGGWRLLTLLKYLWAYDQVILQFTPHFFYKAHSSSDRLRTSLAFFLICVLFGGKIEVVIHETEFRISDSQKGRGLRSFLDRWSWRRCSLITFHSERERTAFSRYYRLPPDRRQFQVAAHDRYFRASATGDREQVRRLLGIPTDKTLLLSIGFIQPHKGFDRLLRAVKLVPSDRLAARVVGSVRISWQPALDCARMLHDIADSDPRLEFIESFVTDEDFDRWIIASDYVVLPYHEIWSSSVAARAKLLHRPVIASSAGALSEQLPEDSITFHNDGELADVISGIAAKLK